MNAKGLRAGRMETKAWGSSPLSWMTVATVMATAVVRVMRGETQYETPREGAYVVRIDIVTA